MRVLFGCIRNAHRHPLAEALMKKLRPDLQVESAGLHVTILIFEEARRYPERANLRLLKAY
jgi:protein-tyrosine-phosphatase